MALKMSKYGNDEMFGPVVLPKKVHTLPRSAQNLNVESLNQSLNVIYFTQ